MSLAPCYIPRFIGILSLHPTQFWIHLPGLSHRRRQQRAFPDSTVRHRPSCLLQLLLALFLYLLQTWQFDFDSVSVSSIVFWMSPHLFRVQFWWSSLHLDLWSRFYYQQDVDSGRIQLIHQYFPWYHGYRFFQWWQQRCPQCHWYRCHRCRCSRRCWCLLGSLNEILLVNLPRMWARFSSTTFV